MPSRLLWQLRCGIRMRRHLSSGASPVGKKSEAVADKLRAELETACKALILEVDKELRTQGTGTPVDTGHARANWVPSIRTPHTGEVTGDGPHSKGVAAVLAFRLGDGSLFVSNGVPYINRLNYGHSKQAPAMFVEACVDRALTRIQTRYAGKVDISGSSARGIDVKPIGG